MPPKEPASSWPIERAGRASIDLRPLGSELALNEGVPLSAGLNEGVTLSAGVPLPLALFFVMSIVINSHPVLAKKRDKEKRCAHCDDMRAR